MFWWASYSKGCSECHPNNTTPPVRPPPSHVWVSQPGGSIMIPAVTDMGMSDRLSYAALCSRTDNAQPWHYLQYKMLHPLPVPHTLCDTQLAQLLNIHKILRSNCACTPSTSNLQFPSVIQHNTLPELVLAPALSFPTQYSSSISCLTP
jgi:hypothetical protein